MSAAVIAISIFARAVTIGCSLIFMTAGIEKLRHRQVLPGVIANYRLLPVGMVPVAAMALPPLECLVGLMLLTEPTPVSAVVGAALLAAFAAAMAANLLRGRRAIHCGCGRLDLRQNLRWTSVIRNAVLAAVLLVAPVFDSPLDAVSIGSAAFGGAAIWIANLLFEAIGALGAASVSTHRSH